VDAKQYLFALPILQAILSNPAEPPERPLPIHPIRSSVFPIYVSKKTLKFCDLSFRDVVPDFKDGEMCPELALPRAPRVRTKATCDSVFKASSHADVYNVKFVQLRPKIQERIDTSGSRRNVSDFRPRPKFGKPFYEPEIADRHFCISPAG